MRTCSEFQDVLQRITEKDLLRKAALLSSCEEPDGIFDDHRLRRDQTFGILVLFRTRPEMEAMMPKAERCADLSEVESLIRKLNAYPKVSTKEYENRRSMYLSALQQYEEVSRVANESANELRRLEAGVRSASQQKAWLERENAARVKRIADIQNRIQNYEKMQRERISLKEGNTGELKRVIEMSGPLMQNLEQDKQRLAEVKSRLDELRDETNIKNTFLHPTLTKLRRMEREKLNAEMAKLKQRIEEFTAELSSLEQTITTLEETRKTHDDEEERLRVSLETERRELEGVQRELDGGRGMVRNVNELAEGLESRIAALGIMDMRTMEDRETAYSRLLSQAQEFLNAWVSSSEELKSILSVEGIGARELVEAIFFACGPLSAYGAEACTYLDSANVQLENLLLYRTEEERAGFWHVESFE